jgi:serine/threonine protein kinase
VAIKVMILSDIGGDVLPPRMQEVELQSLFDNAHIVKVINHEIKPGRRVIVLEHCEGPDLLQFLGASGALDESLVASFTRMILEALADIHSKGVVFRDIKLENVFLARDERGDRVVKLGDFGDACRVYDGMRGVVGTQPYLSPQMVWGSCYCEKTDMWSLGILVCELLRGYAFEGVGDPDLPRVHGGDAGLPAACWDCLSE